MTEGWMTECPDCHAPAGFEGWSHEWWCKHAQTYAPDGSPPPGADVRLPPPPSGPRPLHGPGYCPECSREENHPVYHASI